jgi:gamma-glutamylcyclotransferase (GGCT)/AIG2-like uncharacterized protein YtfP
MNDAFCSDDHLRNCAFVYGTLQVPTVLERVLGRVPRMTVAQLQDYQRGRVSGQSYPAIVAAYGESVTGSVLFDLNDAEWSLLDAYEGELYARHKITVTIDNQQPREADGYVLRPEHSHLFDPTPWSLERFVDHDLATFLNELD